jgi:hypothetical protein
MRRQTMQRLIQRFQFVANPTLNGGLAQRLLQSTQFNKFGLFEPPLRHEHQRRKLL